MKITIREDGSLLVDGEYNTTIIAKEETDIGYKMGINVNGFSDFVKIEGGSKSNSNEITNFIFRHRTGALEFGDHINVGGHNCKFIGVDRSGNNILWNESNKSIEVGYTEEEYNKRRPVKKQKSWLFPNWLQRFRG